MKMGLSVHQVSWIVAKISRTENAFQAFAEPAFLVHLRDAEHSAAMTDQDNNLDLLAEILARHTQKGKDFIKRAAVHQAVKSVGEIDNEALCGLTVAHAFLTFFPKSGSCRDGLKTMNGFFSKLIDQELPLKKDWLDRLDFLGTIRLVPSSGLVKRLAEGIYNRKMCGYTCIGIRKDSEEYNKAVYMLESIGIDKEFLVPNEFLDGYVKLPVGNEQAIEELQFPIGTGKYHLSIDQIHVCKQIWKMYVHNYLLDKQVFDNFKKMWDSFETLSKLNQWWEAIPRSFEITSVGSVLAYANAIRCVPNLFDTLFFVEDLL